MSVLKKDARDGVALWKAIKEAELDDEVAELEAMSGAELDEYIRSNGGDPEKIRAAGKALGAEVLERRARTVWHVEMGAKINVFRDLAATVRARPRLPRADLLRHVEAARNDPRFRTPVAALFREKGPEASTDEELQALCDQLELLAKLHEE